jgi:hypothetical protein
MTTTKRLEELRLNDTIYHDHHDLHSYDYHASLHGHARFPASLSVALRIIDMGWAVYGSFLTTCWSLRSPSVCISTASKRLSDLFAFFGFWRDWSSVPRKLLSFLTLRRGIFCVERL